MKYRLLSTSQRGVLIDRTPIMRDIKDTYEVFFLLPAPGAYVALFTDANGLEYKAVIKDGKARVPKEILGKEQFVGLIVAQTDNEAVLASWECEPLRVTAFFALRQNQWQLSGGFSDKECFDRLIELEKLYNTTLAELAAQKGVIGQLQAKEVEHSESLKTLTEAYNKAIEVVNDLSERLSDLEKNYDPTLIKRRLK